MKKVLKITMSIILGATILSSCSSNVSETTVPVVGISQYGQHTSLDNCREGFLQGLKSSGLKEGIDYTVDYQNAGFDDNVAIQIAQNFSSNNVSLMCAIATPSATSCYAAAENKNIPVVFTAITDPIQANLDSGNITGTSDKLPIDAQLELIRSLLPESKTIGIVYTTSEPNSISAVAEYEEKASSYGFEIESIGVTAQSEVLQATDAIIAKNVDCITNLTDNNVVGVLPSILEKTKDANIPVFGSEIEQVKIGCVASAGIDYVKLGQQTGEIAAKILKGENEASEIPYETISDYDIYVNNEILEDMEIEVPSEILEKSIDVTN